MSIVAVVAHLAYGTLNLSAIPPYVVMRGWQPYIGDIYATFLVAETLMRSPMGSLGDWIGRRPVYVTIGIIGAASAFAWTIVHALWMIFAVRAVDGAVSGGLWTTTIVAMGGTVKKESRTMAMGTFIVTLLTGIALGPIIGGFVNEATDSKITSFYAASAMFLLAALLAMRLIPVRMTDQKEGPPKEKQNIKRIFSGVVFGMKSIPDYIAMAIVIYIPIGMVIPIAKLFSMQELHMTEVEYGLMFLAGGLLLAVVSIGSGRLTKIWGKAKSVHLGFILAAGMMYTIALIHIYWLTVVFAGIIALGFVIALPAWLARVSDLAAPEVRGSVMGALGAGQGVGLIAGVLFGGYMYNSVSFNFFGEKLQPHYTPFLISAFGLTIGAVLSLLFVKENDPRQFTETDLEHMENSSKTDQQNHS